MDKSKLVAVISLVSVVVVLAIGFPLAVTQAETGHEHHGHMEKMDMKEHHKEDVLSLKDIHSKHIPMVSEAIENAVKAIEAGNNEDALAQLHKAQEMLSKINKSVGTYVKPKFLNSKCPIFGTPIDPAKVTEDLVRDYKGQKVAFCCSACPPQWDKLSDAQKDAKLANAKAKPESDGEHMEHEH